MVCSARFTPTTNQLLNQRPTNLPAPYPHPQDFRADRLKLERVEREPGLNTTGMVAWMMNLKTPECPQGRQVVAIANDITYQSGAFGPREDCLFRAATELALEERLPLVYLAANSGARLGVASEIRDNLRVAWVEDEDPTKGFRWAFWGEGDGRALLLKLPVCRLYISRSLHTLLSCLTLPLLIQPPNQLTSQPSLPPHRSYIYLSDEDYTKVLPSGTTMGASVNAEPLTTPSGEKRWVVTDIIGAEDGLGVENLSGSGAIASNYW